VAQRPDIPWRPRRALHDRATAQQPAHLDLRPDPAAALGARVLLGRDLG
jgi:hypothetical protein